MDGWNYSDRDLARKISREYPGETLVRREPMTTGLWIDVITTNTAGEQTRRRLFF